MVLQDRTSATDIAAYLARPDVAYNPATALAQIGYQKWVSLFNEEIEAYSEWRRFGVPTLTPRVTSNDYRY